MFEYFGYEGMERDMAGRKAELNPAEKQNGGVALSMALARVRRKLLETQQRGVFQTSAAEPLCDSCLADYIDVYLGEEDVGDLVVAELRASGGLVSYAFAWEMHRAEAQRLDLPWTFYTTA